MKPDFKASETLAEALRLAGWYPGRQIDITSLTQSIGRLGAIASEAVVSFLREFGDLTIIYTRPAAATISESFDKIRLDPAFGPDWNNLDYGAIVGKPVCPIGDIYRGHMTLLMSPDGSIYGVYDDTVVAFGSNPEMALNTMVTNQETVWIET